LSGEGRPQMILIYIDVTGELYWLTGIGYTGELYVLTDVNDSLKGIAQ